jgi:hypothetical protein
MSEHNGNGNSVVNSVAMMPGRNGGLLKRGGSHNGGRKPSALREAMRQALKPRIKIAQAIADDKDASMSDRLKAIDLLAKYGLGTTVTETDTEGNDVPRGRLTPEERRAALLRELGST